MSSSLQPKIAPHITEIVSRLQQAGFEAYIVGGAVRDFLLERNPKDYDIATAATPEQIRQVFRDRRTLIIGRRFQLVHLFHHDEIIEVSTFRRQPGDQHNLHRPGKDTPENLIVRDNEFGNAEEDAWRRDFTVNALFYDPVNDRITDHTGMGRKDLEDGVVRCIGNPALRFEEDPVRILRAIKLAGQYGFKMEAETEKAIHENMDFIDHAANARLTLELEKILKNPYGDKILRAFKQYDFLRKFLPFIDKRWKTPACRYMMQLLEERNRRVIAGIYRDSISVAMSLMTLPFAEQIIGTNAPGRLWAYENDIDDELWRMLHSVLSPAAITRRASAAAIRTLMLQERVRALELKQLFSHPGYPHARECAIIQNNVMWHLENFEENLPAPEPSARRKRRKHRKFKPAKQELS